MHVLLISFSLLTITQLATCFDWRPLAGSIIPDTVLENKMIEVPPFEEDKTYCRQYLGMNTLKSEFKISASSMSTNTSGSSSVDWARLSYGRSGFCPHRKERYFFKVKFSKVFHITGIAVAGKTKDSSAPPWVQKTLNSVREISISYSIFENPVVVNWVEQEGKKRIIRLPIQMEDTIIVDFKPSIYAGVAKIYVLQYFNSPCLSFEFFGCEPEAIESAVERPTPEPAAEDGCSIFDFEDGTLKGWTQSGEAFKHQPTYGDNRLTRGPIGSRRTGFVGLWFVSTAEHRPSSVVEPGQVTPLPLMGEIMSPAFTVNTTRVSFLVGGGGIKRTTGVELLVDNAPVHVDDGDGRLEMHRVTWEVGHLIGKKAHVRIYDHSNVSYIAFDDFRSVEFCQSACRFPLGMQSRRIKDKQITATAFEKNGLYNAFEARLNNDQGAWCHPKNWANEMFIEIDLRRPHLIDGFTIQKGETSDTAPYFTTLLFTFSPDGNSFVYYATKNSATPKFYDVEKHRYYPVRIYLNPRVVAYKVRLYTISCRPICCLRAELYGCRAPPSHNQRIRESALGKSGYKLGVYQAEDGETAKLPCIRAEFEYLKYYARPENYEWYEILGNSFKKMSLKGDTLRVYFHRKTTGTMKYQCLVKMRGKLFLTSDFVVKHKDTLEIVVMNHPTKGYLGGRAIHTKPPIIETYSPSYSQFAVYIFGTTFVTITQFGCCEQSPYHFIKPMIQWPDQSLRGCGEIMQKRNQKIFCYNEKTKLCSYSENLQEWYKSADTGSGCKENPHKVFKLEARRRGRHGSRVLYTRLGSTRDVLYTVGEKGQFHRTRRRGRHGSRVVYPRLGHGRDIWNTVGENWKVDRSIYDVSPYRAIYEGPQPFEYTMIYIKDRQRLSFDTFFFQFYHHDTYQIREEIIEIRDQARPKVKLPKVFGICERHMAILRPMFQMPYYRAMAKITYVWFRPDVWGVTELSNMERIAFQIESRKNGNLVFHYPTKEDEGQYMLLTKSQFGSHKAYVKVYVETDYPRFQWVTPSPHVVVEKVSDILEVKTTSNNGLQGITWEHRGKIITGEEHSYAFPDDSGKGQAGRKRLLLRRLVKPLDGEYKITVKGRYCDFTATITAIIHLNPLLRLMPPRMSVIFPIGGRIYLIGEVLGGDPAPKMEDIKWYRNDILLEKMLNGSRFSVMSKMRNEKNYRSVLSVIDARVYDAGRYTFEAKSGKAASRRSILVQVLPEWQIELMNKKKGTSSKFSANLYLLIGCIGVLFLESRILR